MIATVWLVLVLVGMVVLIRLNADRLGHRPARPGLVLCLLALALAIGLISPNGP